MSAWNEAQVVEALPQALCEPSDPKDPEALIEEARQRQRRRRLGVIAIILIAVGIVAGIELTTGSGSSPRPVNGTVANPRHSPTTPTSIRTGSSTLTDCTSNDQLYFANAVDGWYLVRSGKILSTTNSGRTWSTSYSGRRCVFSFDFVDSIHGWAQLEDSNFESPTGSELIRTADGGRTWTLATEPRSHPFADVDFFNASDGWALASGGLLYQTMDGGMTWRLAISPTGTSSVCGTAERTWVGLSDGEVLYKVRGSANWVPSLLRSQVSLPPNGRDVPPPPLATAQLFCFGNSAWAVYQRYFATSDVYYVTERTSDGGRSWTAEPEQVGRFALEGGLTSSTDAWFSLDDGEAQGPQEVVTTTDGGRALRVVEIRPIDSRWLKSQGLVSFVSATKAIAIVQGADSPNASLSAGRVVATDNGGITWRVVSSSVPGP